MTERGEPLLWMGVCTVSCAWVRGPFDTAPLGVPASEGV